MVPVLEDWSKDYLIVHGVQVDQHASDYALMDTDLYNELVTRIGEPIISMIGGIHYEMEPSDQVFADRCAVPQAHHYDDKDDMAVLIAR